MSLVDIEPDVSVKRCVMNLYDLKTVLFVRKAMHAKVTQSLYANLNRLFQLRSDEMTVGPFRMGRSRIDG